MAQQDDRRVPVGLPMQLAEANFLQHELQKLGVNSVIRSDRSVGSQPGAVHTLFVAPENAKTAELAREKLLGDPEAGEETTDGTGRQIARNTPFVLGVIGFVTGLRIGGSFLGSNWSPILLGGLLASVVFWVSHNFFSRSESSRNE